ncbi:MAG: hypothetical protein MIO92_01635 [Methanosarcinaceae archaeon]|nr:hypothetical protein [Methanosarcinaceae archaeon]
MQLKFDYYNTNNEMGGVLVDSINHAQRQQAEIYTIFHNNPSHNFTPCEIEDILPQYLLTSIRRAVTNLTKEGKIIKTGKMKIGKYGKQVHTWRLV